MPYDVSPVKRPIYHGDVSWQPKPRRARAGSRSQIHYATPPTPWMQTVPLPSEEDLGTSRPSHVRTASVDSAGSWSPDPWFLQKYAPLPECRDLVPEKVPAGPILIPELAKDNRLKWDVRNLPTGAFFPPLHSAIGLPFVRPDLSVPALATDIRSVSISFDAPRCDVFRKHWGCIIVRAKASQQNAKHGGKLCEAITVFDLMDAIHKYFRQEVSAREIDQASDTSDKRELRQRTGAARLVYTGHSKEGDRYRRVDLLDEFRIRSLKVDTVSENWCHLHLRLR